MPIIPSISPAAASGKHTDLTDKEVGGIIDHADDSVSLAKMSHGTPGKFIGYDNTGAPSEQAGVVSRPFSPRVAPNEILALYNFAVYNVGFVYE